MALTINLTAGYVFQENETITAAKLNLLAKPLTVDAEGWIDLGLEPGMGYSLDEERLARTRIG